MPSVAEIVLNLAPAPSVSVELPVLCCRPTDALHGTDAVSFQAVQQPQLPGTPKTELVSNSDDSQTVIIKMPRVADPATNMQVSHTHVTAHAAGMPILLTGTMHGPLLP